MHNSLNWDKTLNPSLDVIRALCMERDDPQTRYASIHVVGSNGKTSTTRLIEALLSGEGVRTGMTTSPALVEERERIQVEGRSLSLEEWEDARTRIGIAADRARIENPDLPEPSDFEMVTAMALDAFARHEVDVAVVEAGIGGTWDSTCILNPAVTVITSVSLEHTAILGTTIDAIASDKAGAIKPGSTTVLSDGVTDPQARRIFESKAKEVGAQLLTDPLEEYDLEIPSHIPSYQVSNIKAAICATEAILGRRLCEDTVQRILADMVFPGRFEVLCVDTEGKPRVIFDGAHNPEAAYNLAQAIRQARADGRLTDDPVIALGVFQDKDLDAIISHLKPVASAFLPLEPPDNDRGLPRDEVVHRLMALTGVPVIKEWDEVTTLVVTGSLSLYERAQQITRTLRNER